MQNLDYLTAKYGQAILEEGLQAQNKAKTLGEAATKALAVLHEQGLFAMFLWLHEDKPGRKMVGLKLSAMLTDEHYSVVPGLPDGTAFFGSAPSQVKSALDAVRDHLTKDVTRMLFVKDLVAQALVYARHRAKAEPTS